MSKRILHESNRIATWCAFFAFILTCTTPIAALEIIREVEPGANKQSHPRARFQPDVIEQWLFNGQAKFSTARQNLEKKLDAKLNVISRVCELTQEQRAKLHLAGSGDINRFLRECQKMQRGFDATDQQKMNNLWQELQPLRNRFNASLFENNSMFARVQKSALEKEQFKVLERRRRERLEFAVETAIHQVIAQFDNAAPLNSESRKALTDLLTESVPLPAAMDTTQQRQLAQQYVLFSCSKIPPEKLEAIVGEENWRILSQGIQNCAGYLSHFQSIGMIKKEE